ncbi:MAG: glycosyl hydrolase, partial [Clostridiales bacterium]|nr:glycosyl hydrolase [Clostridiales bacterium]
MPDLFDYRPAPLWFLNHKLEKEEIKRQIGLMKNCGVSGFFMHPRAGLLTQYGSEEWFDIIKYIVELAEEAGLKAWLYDEDPFPSGIAGGWVVFDNPGYAARSVRVKKLLPDENGRVVSSLGRGRLLSVIALKTDSSGNISEFMELTGAVGIIRPKFFKTPFDCAYFAVMIDEKKYEHVRAETSYPELHIDVELEGPEWAVYVSIDDIIRVGDQSGVFPDNLSRECVRSFLNFTHEKYNKTLGGRFGNSIPGIFTDEAVPGGWTPGFAELFEKEKGYKIESNFHHFVDTFGPESRKIRQDYWSVLHGMFKENFFGQISSWCRQHSLKLTGHVWGEDDPLNHVFAGGNAFAYQKYFDIPGFDIVGTNLGDRIYPGLNFGGKLISSAAHQQGKRQVISECFGGNPFNFGMDGMMKFAGWLFSLGITWLSP